MTRLLAGLLTVVSLLIACAVAAAWLRGSSHPDAVHFLWHGQRCELHSVGWRLCLDNEPQRQTESAAPRAEACRLLDRLDQIDLLPHSGQIIMDARWPRNSTEFDQELKRQTALAREEQTILSQVAALGYIPSLMCGESSRIPMNLLLNRIPPIDWPHFRVERHDGEPVFLFQPAPAQPRTHAASVAIPFPLLLALALLLPARTARQMATVVQRYRHGLCPTCGYDVWVNYGYCPECGVPVPDRTPWTRGLSNARRLAQRTWNCLRKAWTTVTPRTDHLQERWLFYVFAWLAIAEFPIIVFDILAEMFEIHTDWCRIGLSMIRLLLDGVIATGSVFVTRGIEAPAT